MTKRIRWKRFKKSTLWQTTLAYDADPVDADEAAAQIEEVTEQLYSWMSQARPGLTKPSLESDIQNAFYQPAYTPPVQSALVAENGDLWLERTGDVLDGEGDAELTEWWILDDAGEWQGRAHTPADLRILRIESEAVWGVVTDDFDVNYIVRLPWSDRVTS